MMWKVTLILSIGLLSGCVSSECDWTRALRFDNADTINWLADNDRGLLQDIVVHNETRERLCR